uniref:Uncharacterized protein n=1 Tax=Timema douglasi TaxID=61478 RepID=A0A7R8VG56_TIMDO|nr:unnamed protein product [Timema douglasi]
MACCSYEDENKFEDALKSYENCLALIPFHEEAQNSIEYLKNKILNSSKLSEPTEVIPGLSSSKTLEVKETLKQLLKTEEEEEKKDEKKSKSKKKKDRKSRKRRRRSSSSSSSSTSGSSRSSSSSSSSSSESSSGSSHSGSSPSRSRKSKKHKKRSKKDEKREKSLSPLSKRMALMDPSNEGEGLGGLLAQRLAHYNPPALPFSFARSAAAFQVAPELSKMYDKELEYEQRVCRFLEQTKGDSEYEEKVRKFLEETARWKKERKAQEEKAKKKKKKEKKSKEKEKSKKKKRDDHDKKKKHKKQSRSSEKFDAKEFEEQMESKKFRDALRKELSAKEDFRKRKSIDDEEEFLYGSSDKKDLRMMGMDHIPDLDELESKLSAYYAKVEKDPGLPKGNFVGTPFTVPTSHRDSRCRDYLLPPTATPVLPGLPPTVHRDTCVAGTPALYPSTLTIGSSTRWYTPVAPAKQSKTLKITSPVKQCFTRGPLSYHPDSHTQTPRHPHSAPTPSKFPTPEVAISSPRLLLSLSPEGYHLQVLATPQPAYVFSPISLLYLHPLDPRDLCLATNVTRRLHFE